jgi:hypothetical protein
MVRAQDYGSAQQFLEQEAMLDVARSRDSAAIRIADKPVVLRVYRDMPAAYVARSVLDAVGDSVLPAGRECGADELAMVERDGRDQIGGERG